MVPGIFFVFVFAAGKPAGRLREDTEREEPASSNEAAATRPFAAERERMGAMTLKKLDVTDTRRNVIAKAVTETMMEQPEHMRMIYESVLRAIEAPYGKTLLIPSQASVMARSLERHGDGSYDCISALDQITMTRRAYQAKYPELIPAF